MCLILGIENVKLFVVSYMKHLSAFSGPVGTKSGKSNRQYHLVVLYWPSWLSVDLSKSNKMRRLQEYVAFYMNFQPNRLNQLKMAV
jgi:hypothetical protein